MLRILCWLFLIFAVVSSTAQEPDLLDAFRASVTVQPLIFKNFCADAICTYAADDEHLSGTEPSVREFALIEMRKVELHGDVLEMQADRVFLLKDAATGKLMPTSLSSPVTIRVSMRTGSVANMLRAAKQEIFWPSLAVAVASLPDYLQGILPPVFDLQRKQYVACLQCGRGGTDPRQGQIYSVGKDGVSSPSLTHQEELYFPKSFQGTGGASVTLVCVVDVQGQPSEFWYVRPTGFGFDEAALGAVRKYRYVPAKRHGVAVPVVIQVQTSFMRQ